MTDLERRGAGQAHEALVVRLVKTMIGGGMAVFVSILVLVLTSILIFTMTLLFLILIS
jgi:hypothetical protein